MALPRIRTARSGQAVGRHGLGEEGPGDEGGGEPWFGGVRVGAGDADGPGAVHLGGDLGLAAETGPEVGLFGVLRADHLDRGERAVFGPAEVDDAHAARAEASEEPVAADPGGVRGVERLHQPAAFPSSCLACSIIRLVPWTTKAVSSSSVMPFVPLAAMATVTGPYWACDQV